MHDFGHSPCCGRFAARGSRAADADQVELLLEVDVLDDPDEPDDDDADDEPDDDEVEEELFESDDDDELLLRSERSESEVEPKEPAERLSVL